MTLANMREVLSCRSVDPECRECLHAATVDVDALPDELAVPDVGLRLRCSSCGSKQIVTRPNLVELPGGYPTDLSGGQQREYDRSGVKDHHARKAGDGDSSGDAVRERSVNARLGVTEARHGGSPSMRRACACRVPVGVQRSTREPQLQVMCALAVIVHQEQINLARGVTLVPY
jgi:hypothetical protein